MQDGVAANDWLAMIGLDGMALSGQAQQAWSDGYYPFAGSYQQGSEMLPTFDVLWIKRSPGLSLQLRYSLDDVLFAEQDQQWRRAGYHLEDAVAYADAGVRRYAGMWVRHEPYLRWHEDFPIAPDDPTYLAQWKPFHDQVIAQMTIEDGPTAGEYLRPSSTLHIFDGPTLVLNRAYTFAPAIYPDTQLDAPMSLASASKAITAAAVVRQLNIDGLPLTIPYGSVAGVLQLGANPTVLEVLRNRGGFTRGPTSYGDHSMIDQSPYGTYPITGKMMFDYAVLGGHIGGGDMLDRYWDPSIYIRSSTMGDMIYSNPGYTMLGEMLRVESGLSYADHVRISRR